MTTAYTHARLYTGQQVLDDHTLVISGDTIVAIHPSAEAVEAEAIHDCTGWSICPGLIDVQVYGGGGALFSTHPTLATLENLATHCYRHGTIGFLATLPTSPPALMEQAIEAGCTFKAKYPQALFGLHLEGPFLNTAKCGAHPTEWILPFEESAFSYWLQRGKGVVQVMTIAPEFLTPTAIALASASGVRLSAGHSNATYDQATAAFQQGVPLATHLFNAMSALGHRAPGLVGAIFDHPRVCASVIADGVHVDYAVVRTAKRLLGERLLLITDAVDDSGKGIYQFYKKDDYYVNAAGVLSGSALTLPSAVHNCVTHEVCDLAEALRMASLYPARALHIDHYWGQLKVGFSGKVARFHDEDVQNTFQPMWALEIAR